MCVCVCFGRGWFSFLPACVYRNSSLKGLPAVHVHIKQSAKHTLCLISADEGGPNVIVQQLVLEPVGHDSFTLDLTGQSFNCIYMYDTLHYTDKPMFVLIPEN